MGNNNGKVNKQWLPWVLLGVIILCLSAYMVYWGTQKEGLHIDEMFSVMDIRGRGLDRPYNDDDFFNTWHIASGLESTIGVASINAFTAVGTTSNPYRNLLHIAYSLWPDEFTIWPSVALNLLIFAGSLIMVYLLSLMFIGDRYLALLPGLAWGFSSAAVNLILFIRFYTFKTFFCLLLTYVVFTAVRNGFKKWSYPVAIVIVTGIGVFIHQYFFIYAFFLTAFVCLYMLAMKEYKPLLKFSGVMIAAAAVYQIITGDGISRLFTGTDDRAEEAVRNLFQGNEGYIARIQEYFNIVSEAVFGGISFYIVLALFAMLAFIIYIKHAKKGIYLLTLLSNQKVTLWIIIGLVCLFYLLMIARIAPYQEIRYIFCVIPFIITLFITLLVSALKAVGFKSTMAMFSIILLLSLLLPVGNIRKFNLHWDAVKTDEALASYYHLPVVCIGDRKLEVASCYWQLFEFEDKVMFATTDEVDYDVIGQLPYEDGLILMLWYESDETETKRVMDAAGLDRCTHVMDLVRHEVYLLENEK